MPGIGKARPPSSPGRDVGFGRGIAMLLGREGARVVVCDVGASLQGGLRRPPPTRRESDSNHLPPPQPAWRRSPASRGS